MNSLSIDVSITCDFSRENTCPDEITRCRWHVQTPYNLRICYANRRILGQPAEGIAEARVGTRAPKIALAQWRRQLVPPPGSRRTELPTQCESRLCSGPFLTGSDHCARRSVQLNTRLADEGHRFSVGLVMPQRAFELPQISFFNGP
jgi:hypothetical protein